AAWKNCSIAYHQRSLCSRKLFGRERNTSVPSKRTIRWPDQEPQRASTLRVRPSRASSHVLVGMREVCVRSPHARGVCADAIALVLSPRVASMAEAAPSPRRDDTGRPDELKKVHRTETKTKTPAEAKRQGPTLDLVKADARVRTFIRSANAQTGAIGYTEHGERHANTAADGARFI